MTSHIIPPSRETVERYVAERINQQCGNCWQFVQSVQFDLFGIALPPILDVSRMAERDRLFRQHPELEAWRQVEAPEHGAVVIMSQAVLGRRDHAGVYLEIDGGGVLHSDADHGVVFDSLLELAARRWRPEYYVRC